MTPKKTAYILEHDALLHFRTLSDFIFLGSLTVFGTNSILNKFHFQNKTYFLIMYIHKLLNQNLKSSDRIKPFQFKSICFFEYLNKFFCIYRVTVDKDATSNDDCRAFIRSYFNT